MLGLTVCLARKKRVEGDIMFIIKAFNTIKKSFFCLFKRRSAPCVKRRLKEVIASDRLALPSSVTVKIQESIREILLREMGACELLCAITGKSQNGNTELVINISVSQAVNTSAA